MKHLILVTIFFLKMCLACQSQNINSKSAFGFGVGAKLSRLIVDEPELKSTYNTGLNLTALTYEYKINPKIRLGFKVDLMFNDFLLSKNSVTETTKYTTIFVPIKISYYPVQGFPIGISSSIGANYLIKKQQIEFMAPDDLRKMFGSFEGEVFFDKAVKNIVLRPFLNYGQSITNLLSKDSNPEMKTNYHAFSFGLIIF
jgi:hypothetical protein